MALQKCSYLNHTESLIPCYPMGRIFLCWWMRFIHGSILCFSVKEGRKTEWSLLTYVAEQQHSALTLEQVIWCPLGCTAYSWNLCSRNSDAPLQSTTIVHLLHLINASWKIVQVSSRALESFWNEQVFIYNFWFIWPFYIRNAWFLQESCQIRSL